MRSTDSNCCRKTQILASSTGVTLLAFTCWGLAAGSAWAGHESKDPPLFSKSSDYSSAKDWNLAQAEPAGPTKAKPAKTPGSKAKTAGITESQAIDIALKEIPGKSTSVAIEKKAGHQVYVVEILTPEGAEKDVWVDIKTGKVVGTD
jgi:Peptidase propeptide and YPEB domain